LPTNSLADRSVSCDLGMKKSWTVILITLLLTSVSICFSKVTMDASSSTVGMSDYWPTAGWLTSTPEAQGMNSTKLNQMMIEYVRNGRFEFHSVVVVRNGYIVLEEYPDAAYNQNTKHQLYSVTKSFTSALVGIAIEEGFIDNVDHKVVDFFPNRAISNLDSRKQSMALKDVLTMTSGLEWDEWTYNYSDPRNDVVRMMSNADWVQFVLDRPMVADPGTEWVYNSGGSHLLSAIVNQTIGTNQLEFAEEHLFEPLGISDLFWRLDYQGLPYGLSDLYLTPRDMAKFGFLYLNNGTWDGEQVVPSVWVAESTQTHFSLQETLGDEYLGYGYQWWTLDTPTRVYQAMGYGGQKIIVVPSQDIVVVLTADMIGSPDPTYEMLYDYILPAVLESPTLSADLNSDGVVDINDIAIIAIAFGSEQGQDNWNAIADVDKNGLIDILDISKIAVDFGHTLS